LVEIQAARPSRPGALAEEAAGAGWYEAAACGQREEKRQGRQRGRMKGDVDRN